RDEREEACAVGGDTRRCEHVDEDPQRFVGADSVRRDGLPGARSELFERDRMIEWYRVETKAFERVAEDDVGEVLRGRVEVVQSQ
ncbi:MAG TPA: hypothetical protein VHP57_08905, partial [Acidimicrobiia bacterium]|nr:hypothetical protein [Acidimicrobiia bacterium]